ncbi:MAG: TonB C-terminal domain-containing protein [Burkholderiales bacterium]
MYTVNDPGRFASGVMAFSVHVIFFGLLFFGVSWQKKPVGPVLVELWGELPEPERRPAVIEPQAARPLPEIKKQLPPPPPPPRTPIEVAPPKPTAAEIELKEKRRLQKEEQARLQEERKQAEAEKRRLEEEKRHEADAQRRAESEQKLLRQEREREEAEARRVEEKRRAEEQELKRELERKERAAALEREQRKLDAIRKQKEAEEARNRADSAERAAHAKKISEFVDKIMVKIRSRVVMPPNIDGNPEARFDVVLLPGGEVLSATLTKTSGSAAYDAAVERAIHAAQPLPVPSESELFQDNFRELSLLFRPKD